jgi:hypothetical protein
VNGPYNSTYLLDVLKNEFVEVDEAMFKVSKGHAKSFSAAWASKKAPWMKSLK